jgi:hypothetical protein
MPLSNTTPSKFPAVVIIAFMLVVAVGSTCSVYAQTDYASDARVRHETKKGVRQAKKIKSDYQDTHLTIENKPKKKGLFRRKKAK